MKKLSLIILLALIADLSIFGQYKDTDPWKSNKSIMLDKSTIEAVYSVKLTDKDFEQPRQYYSILEVGKNFTKFSDYYRWRCDSVLSGLDTLKLTNGDVNKINNSNYYSFGKSDYIITDLKHNKTSEYNFVFGNHYFYSEDTPKLNWVLESDRRIIQGIKCDKATLDFRGRKWTAWYDPSNPLSFGPWKFHGLPGAIIEIYDESGDVCISLIEIREGSKYILKPNKVYDELKRTGYLKAVKYLLKDGGGSKTIAPPANSLGQHIKPRTHKLFYVAMELE